MVGESDEFSAILDVDPYEIVQILGDEPLAVEVGAKRVRRQPPRKPHPILVKIWRRPLEDDLERLIERVRLYGQRDRIEVLDDLIISGWAEYEACLRAAVTPRFTEITEPRSIVEYVVRRNIPEQMSPLDRACVAVLAYQEAAKEQTRERMREAGRVGGLAQGKGRDEIARPFTKAERWFEKAARVVGCTPGAVKAVAKLYNNESTRDVFFFIRRRLLKTTRDALDLAALVPLLRERRDVVAIYAKKKGKVPIRKVVAEYRRTKRKDFDGPDRGKNYVVYEGVLEGHIPEKGAKIPNESIDAIYADLVYDDPTMAENIALLAKRVLVPGGAVAIVNGNGDFDQVVQALRRHLRFVALGAVHLEGGVEPIPNRVQKVDCLPVFYFCKGEVVLHPIGHLRYTSQVFEKDKHVWQKTVDSTLQIIEAMVDRGSTVLDPCAGSGTTGESALRCGCRFIGIEKEPKAAAETRGRLHKVERELEGGKSGHAVATTS